MSYLGTTPLFAPGPNPRAPALPWRSDAFFAVDDRVRGGTSHSHMAIVQYPPVSRGEIIFSGFLDTTTLGGAGFASQSSSVPFPVTLSKDDFQGFRIVVRKETNWSEPTPPPSDGSNPGGGKGPVTSFVFQIKTEEPERRPDGRRESVIVWEWSFTIPPSGDDDENDGERCPSLNIALSNDDFWVFDSTWTDFKPFYRGRPVDPDTAGEFYPQKTHEWSFMARSNFQIQSGPFALQLHSLSALPTEDQFAATAPHPTTAVLPVEVISGEVEGWVDEKGDPQQRRRPGGSSFRSSPSSSKTSSLEEAPPAAVSTRSSKGGEYYGFALFIFATVLWIGWLFWALTPDEWLESVGIAWYPNREWAFLIPAWSCMAMLAAYAVFIGLNARQTPELDDINNVTDMAQNVYSIAMEGDGAERHLFDDPEKLRESLHDIYDLPPTYVSRQMHLS